MEGKTYRVKSEQVLQGMKKMKVEKSWRGGIKRLDSKKKEFWRKVESTGDGLPSERNSMKEASLMWDPLPATTTTPGYNCLPHFTSENCQASSLFLPSLSLSFSSPRPHIRFSSNVLTISLLVEYEPTRAMTFSHTFDKNTSRVTVQPLFTRHIWLRITKLLKMPGFWLCFPLYISLYSPHTLYVHLHQFDRSL